MDTSEKLKDALIRVGDKKHIDLLTTQAKNLTKDDITDLLNNKLDDKLTLGTIRSLRKLSKQRIIEGKSAFPYESMEDVQHNEADDNMGGGTW
ncbi:hypothetical protein [Runella salmonicolor]|uniref:Uncharacterized protein n=1 Tax=Runella salmonicolor TaxID=2950278 RepID=A0ABT1FK51_9BACT|nr:hypothetical protein [Runella salmonicolor]MCP1382114.1 hypothetical protein [Runella salmonicolor]